MRESREGGVGGGRLRIDFPGIGIVTAEDDGEHEELEAAMNTSCYTLTRIYVNSLNLVNCAAVRP